MALNWAEFIRTQQESLSKTVYGTAGSYMDLLNINLLYLNGDLPNHPRFTGAPLMDTTMQDSMWEFNKLGFLADYSQAGYPTAQESEDKSIESYDRDAIEGLMPIGDAKEFATRAKEAGLVVCINGRDIYCSGEISNPREIYDLPSDEKADILAAYKNYINSELYAVLRAELVSIYICHPNPGRQDTDEIIFRILKIIRKKSGLPEVLCKSSLKRRNIIEMEEFLAKHKRID